jgi:hypothetical protein
MARMTEAERKAELALFDKEAKALDKRRASTPKKPVPKIQIKKTAAPTKTKQSPAQQKLNKVVGTGMISKIRAAAQKRKKMLDDI